jgi:V/A-type H+-transporting ATPase subunit A
MFNKSEILDFVILQQDGFDDIDASTPMNRQKYMLNKVLEVCDTEFTFESFEGVFGYFRKVINLFKQMNYLEFQCDEFKKRESELDVLIEERRAS